MKKFFIWVATGDNSVVVVGVALVLSIAVSILMSALWFCWFLIRHWNGF